MRGRRGRPEWFVLGKPHADRAKQFKPFAALRGYDEMVDEMVSRSQQDNDRPIDLEDVVDQILYGEFLDFDPAIDLHPAIEPGSAAGMLLNDGSEDVSGSASTSAGHGSVSPDSGKSHKVVYGTVSIGDDDVP